MCVGFSSFSCLGMDGFNSSVYWFYYCLCLFWVDLQIHIATELVSPVILLMCKMCTSILGVANGTSKTEGGRISKSWKRFWFIVSKSRFCMVCFYLLSSLETWASLRFYHSPPLILWFLPFLGDSFRFFRVTRKPRKGDFRELKFTLFPRGGCTQPLLCLLHLLSWNLVDFYLLYNKIDFRE